MTVTRELVGQYSVVVHRVRAADGALLALTRVEPEGDAHRTPILFAHGTFSNRTMWLSTNGKGLAPYLAAAGYDNWILETRGHGQVRQRRMRPSTTAFDAWINYDVPAALDYVSRHTGRPAFWIGHSAGGVIIYAHLARYPESAAKLRGIVSFGSQSHYAARTPGGWIMVYFTVAVSHLCGHFPARLLRLGPENEFLGVMTQWAGWNLKREWRSLDGFDYQTGLHRVRCPVLALAGGGDRFLAPEPGCRALFDALGSSDKRFILYSQANGHAEDYDHITLVVGRNAPREIWPTVHSWLNEH